MFVPSHLNHTTDLASHSVDEPPCKSKQLHSIAKHEQQTFEKQSTKEIQTVRKQEEGHSQTIIN